MDVNNSQTCPKWHLLYIKPGSRGQCSCLPFVPVIHSFYCIYLTPFLRSQIRAVVLRIRADHGLHVSCIVQIARYWSRQGCTRVSCQELLFFHYARHSINISTQAKMSSQCENQCVYHISLGLIVPKFGRFLYITRVRKSFNRNTKGQRYPNEHA